MGDSALRMLAATVNEAMLSIPPPAKPNHISPPEKSGNSSTTQSSDAKTKGSAATKKVSKSSTHETELTSHELMTKFMQSLANATSNSSTSQQSSGNNNF